MNPATRTADLSHLDGRKRDILETSLTKILNSDVGVNTYAQIIDGQPTRTSFINECGYVRDFTHVSERLEPTAKSVNAYRDITSVFSVDTLRIDVDVAQAYQNTPPDSRDENLRLLEIIADSIHNLAALLYTSFHPETDIHPVLPRPNNFHRTDHFFVDFFHKCYKFTYARFPFGLLNVVGYWAEVEILGGVLLFERGHSGVENKNAFVQPQQVHGAFQLPEQDLELFAGLGRKSSHPDSLGTPQVLPFREPSKWEGVDAWSQCERRIYKHEWDLPETIGTRRNCVRLQTEDDREVIRIGLEMHEKRFGKPKRRPEDLEEDRF